MNIQTTTCPTRRFLVLCISPIQKQSLSKAFHRQATLIKQVLEIVIRISSVPKKRQDNYLALMTKKAPYHLCHPAEVNKPVLELFNYICCELPWILKNSRGYIFLLEITAVLCYVQSTLPAGRHSIMHSQANLERNCPAS